MRVVIILFSCLVVGIRWSGSCLLVSSFIHPCNFVTTIKTIQQHRRDSSIWMPRVLSLLAENDENNNNNNNNDGVVVNSETQQQQTKEASKGDRERSEHAKSLMDNTRQNEKEQSNEFVEALMEKSMEISKNLFSNLKSALFSEDSTGNQPSKVGGSRSSVGKTGMGNDSNEALEVFVDKTIEISKAAFAALRLASAKALTASLPDNEREEVLNRLKPARSSSNTNVATPPTTAAADDEVKYEDSVSVKEKIAAAVAAESQRDQERWEQEKASIIAQAEQAANERVAMEIEVQKQRIERERQELIEDIESSKKQLENEKSEMIKNVESTKEQLEKEKEEMMKNVQLSQEKIEEEKAALSQQQTKQQEEIRISKEELEKLAAEEKAELEKIQQGIRKREQQKKELAALEDDLRQRAQQVRKDKEEVEKLVMELQTMREHSEREMERSNASSPPQPPSKEKVDGTDVGYYTPKEYRSLSQEEKAKIKALRAESRPESTSIGETDVHPVLGPVVSDLGYKRVHLMSAGKLGTVPIWEKQRIYRHTRAKAMASDKEKTLHLGYPGVICLYEDNNGKLTIIDGQHRVGMMQVLKEKFNKEVQDGNADSTNEMSELDQVLVEVYSQKASNENLAEEIFLEINKAEPVKLIDMPGVANAKDRNVITEAVDRLRNQYPEMFSSSQRCRAPNVNVDNMRNNLFGADIMKRHNLTTGKQLHDWMMEQNAALGKKYENNEEAQGWINEKAWKKASRNGFYLGLESTWLYN